MLRLLASSFGLLLLLSGCADKSPPPPAPEPAPRTMTFEEKADIKMVSAIEEEFGSIDATKERLMPPEQKAAEEPNNVYYRMVNRHYGGGR